ncbi:MAG: tetratricopeptide repeat protein [Candidatus Omnitrophica bacterium]|nr:tetratricopeptide repeat protein [Candidatus Omnitrophota bacterium]
MASSRQWLIRLRIPAAVVLVAGLLVLYNRFILNANLQNLKTSLYLMDSATGVGQAEVALLLVDQTLVEEISRENINLKTVATLQYAQGTLAASDLQRPVDDAQILVASLAEDQAVSRPALLATLDGIATGVQSVLTKIQLLPRQIVSKPADSQIDPVLLEKAAKQEQLGLFPEAAKIYEQLLEAYPLYKGRAVLRLRLGYLYQKERQFDRAEALYRQALAQAVAAEEAATARQMLLQLDKAKKVEWEAKRLEQEMEILPPGVKRQETAYRLGTAFLQLYAMDQASSAFKEAVDAYPGGDLTLPALFKEAWCLRAAGRFEEAFRKFQNIIQGHPGTEWATASYQQIAEFYRATGDHEEAARSYQQAIRESQDPAYTALLHAFTGSLYLYDVKNPEAAATSFEILKTMFPASAYSAMDQQINRIRTEKGLEPLAVQLRPDAATALGRPDISPDTAQFPTQLSLEAGGPVVSWLEKFLPVFVEVFMDRLAKYMEVTGTPKLTRRYTETEFRELVLSRVQQRYVDQVREVDVKIRPDGFVGSGKVKLGILVFPLEARIGVFVKDEIPHAQVHEVKIGNLSVPENILKILEDKTNLIIESGQYPLRIKQYELREGYALISVELVNPKSGTRQGEDTPVLDF